MTPAQKTPPRRRVEVVEYNAEWPRQFTELKNALWSALDGIALRIEHVGSTSVPGLIAKPIIDMDAVIPSVKELPAAIDALAGLGYTHRGDLGIPEREAFGRDGETVPRDGSGRFWPSHHLYVCPQNSRELARHLALRDYLRARPDCARDYAALKRDLARRHEWDINAYIEGKTQFIETVYQKAASEITTETKN